MNGHMKKNQWTIFFPEFQILVASHSLVLLKHLNSQILNK